MKQLFATIVYIVKRHLKDTVVRFVCVNNTLTPAYGVILQDSCCGGSGCGCDCSCGKE